MGKLTSNDLQANLLKGWSILNTTITTTGTPSVLASSVDVSGILSPGDKIWIVQSTNKYVYVLAVDATTITVTQSSDYTIVGTGVTAISAIYFSKLESPTGFPGGFNYSPTSIVGFSAVPSGAMYRFSMKGRQVTLSISQPNNGTSNATNFTVSLPVTAASVGTGWQWVMPVVQPVDNGAVNAANSGIATIVNGGTVITFLKDASGNLWTASGGKRVPWFQMTYEAA